MWNFGARRSGRSESGNEPGCFPSLGLSAITTLHMIAAMECHLSVEDARRRDFFSAYNRRPPDARDNSPPGRCEARDRKVKLSSILHTSSGGEFGASDLGGFRPAEKTPTEPPAGHGGQFSLPCVAALNLSPNPGDLEGNLRMAEEEISRAKRDHPFLKWVVLPELFTSGYSDLATSSARHAEDAEHGMSVWLFSALAHDLGLFIAYGFPESLLRGGVSNSANLVGPEGPGALLTYRKKNLVRTTSEHGVFVPGFEVPVVEAGGMRVALVVCWDLGHPETVREAAMDGADLILAPAAWRDPWGPQYDLARALDNGVYVASANQLGRYLEASFTAPGSVHAPDGLLASKECGRASSPSTRLSPHAGGTASATHCGPPKPASGKPVRRKAERASLRVSGTARTMQNGAPAGSRWSEFMNAVEETWVKMQMCLPDFC